MASKSDKEENVGRQQYSTFFIGKRWFGIDVTQVQEIVRTMPITDIPLAKDYVRGLINLRGQVATAIGLRELFEIRENQPEHLLNVVCRVDNHLLSLQVDEIGDVITTEDNVFEPTPQTIPDETRVFLSGVYKLEEQLLSIVEIDSIVKRLEETA